MDGKQRYLMCYKNYKLSQFAHFLQFIFFRDFYNGQNFRKVGEGRCASVLLCALLYLRGGKEEIIFNDSARGYQQTRLL